MNKLILADCDGVLLNWEYAFQCWMESHGYHQVDSGNTHYDMSVRYSISKSEAVEKIKIFNESAAIGFLPALRDSVYYVKRLHEEHGYKFGVITSLSLDPSAGHLREMNLKKIFGESTFDFITCLDTGADKDDALECFKDSGLWWIEDKMANAQAGLNVGLKPILIEHGFNMKDNVPAGMFKATNWKEIYHHIVN